MQWWNDFVDWLFSDDGWRVVSTAIVPLVAIIVASLIAVGISRASVTRILAREDRDDRAAAVAVFIEVARQSTQWSLLPGSNQDHLETLASAASVRLRLLPTHGAAPAAEWAEHQIAKIRSNSDSFTVQAEQDYVEFRDRLAEWQHKPKAARRLFAIDLEQFKFENKTVVDEELVEKQQQWAVEQAAAEQASAEAAAERAAIEQAEADEALAREEAEAAALAQSEADQAAAERARAASPLVVGTAAAATASTVVPPLVEPSSPSSFSGFATSSQPTVAAPSAFTTPSAPSAFSDSAYTAPVATPAFAPETVAAEPVAAEPVAAEPVVSEPAAYEPAATEAAGTEAAAYESAAAEPAPTEALPTAYVPPTFTSQVGTLPTEAPVEDSTGDAFSSPAESPAESAYPNYVTPAETAVTDSHSDSDSDSDSTLADSADQHEVIEATIDDDNHETPVAHPRLNDD